MTAALILFGVSAAVAQSAVTGKIVDETGAPLIGASVTVPGTSQGVSTDVDGNFTLKTDAKEIEISYVGYVPTKKPVMRKCCKCFLILFNGLVNKRV